MLAIFAKSPVAGQVKTRLCPPLDPVMAATLYAAFLRDTVRKAARVLDRPTLFYTGSRAALEAALVADGGSAPSLAWAAQGDGDLGARMARVPAPCVIIGADSPSLPISFLRDALSALAETDVVLGPAEDGGYTLIGLRAPRPELFAGIAWGTDQVLKQTLAVIETLGLAVTLLPPWYDIDTVEDLRRLRVDLQTSGPDDCPATRALLDLL